MTVKDLIQVQLGKETVWGTGVAATAKLMGVVDAMHQPVVNAKVFAERRASLDPGYVTALTGLAGGMRIEGTVLYEDFPYFLDGLISEATPSGGGPYTRTYASGSAYTPRPSTAYIGSSAGMYRLLGGVVNGLTIRGAAGENDTELTYTAELIGKQLDTTGSLASLSDRTATPAMASHLALYIDAWAGTIGTTAITTAFSFELGLNLNRMLKRYLGSLLPATYETAKADPAGNTLRLSLNFDATSKALLDVILGGSSVFQRQVRIKATSGTNILQFDFAGTTVAAPEVFTDVDGVLSVDIVLNATYNSALGGWFAAQSVNSVSALP